MTNAGLREAIGKFLESKTRVANRNPLPQLKAQFIDKFPVRVVTKSLVVDLRHLLE